ncbi:MAG: lysine-2,3-aminomutase-like protein [Alphaproteobacteria bacterium]|nr:lysine-2,3-aminomutase-like protein [Alphaproteobacteria bacterium]
MTKTLKQTDKGALATQSAPLRISHIGGLQEAGFSHSLDDRVLESVAQHFAVGLSPHLVKLIRRTGEDGPVGRQYLPDARELLRLPGEEDDPIGDISHSPVKGLVHRYPDRVLLKIAAVCAVYCRFCFRRELIGPGSEMLSAEELVAALSYIRDHPEIREVILTGGDPLVLSPARLKAFIHDLNGVSSVKILRIHSRVPVADPARVNDAMLEALSSSRQAVYVALHINHEAEITPEMEDVVRALRRTGCMLLSQSVLLKGINDDPAVLTELYYRLSELGVRPYELHHPDRARGTGHFRLSLEEGRSIVGQLRGRISGLCQPHYMLDIPGGHGKVEVLSHKIARQDDGSYLVEDHQGQKHIYRDL